MQIEMWIKKKYYMIINGNKIRNEILVDLKKQIAKIGEEGRRLRLAIFVVGDDAVIENFIAYKKKVAEILGMEFLEYRYSGEEKNLENLIIEKIKKIGENDKVVLKEDKKVNGIVVQLPLPKKLETEKILAAIPTTVDIDVLNGKNKVLDLYEKNKILPPVTGAVWEILQRNKVELKNKKVLIVGNGKLVGQPTYDFLKNKCAEIAVITSQTKNKEEFYREADVIISGVGIPNLIQPEMIKEGVVLIDAGTSTSAKELNGDIALSCESKASVFSKTPGGVGPITIAILYQNLLLLTGKENIKNLKK